MVPAEPTIIDLPISKRERIDPIMGCKVVTYSNGYQKIKHAIWDEQMADMTDAVRDTMMQRIEQDIMDKLTPDLTKHALHPMRHPAREGGPMGPTLTLAAPTAATGNFTGIDISSTADTTVTSIGTLTNGMSIFDRTDGTTSGNGFITLDEVGTSAADNGTFRDLHLGTLTANDLRGAMRDSLQFRTFISDTTTTTIGPLGGFGGLHDVRWDVNVGTNAGWDTSVRKTRHALRIVEGPEDKARRMLKRMIGERSFRGYMKNGFVTFRGVSGKVYQIFPGHEMVRVWDKAEPIEKLCLVFSDHKIPPTDGVIMRMLLIDRDEEGFKKMAVVWPFSLLAALPRENQLPERGRIARMAAEQRSAGGIIVAA